MSDDKHPSPLSNAERRRTHLRDCPKGSSKLLKRPFFDQFLSPRDSTETFQTVSPDSPGVPESCRTARSLFISGNRREKQVVTSLASGKGTHEPES